MAELNKDFEPHLIKYKRGNLIFNAFCGFKGTIITDKVTSKGQMYAIIDPIIQKDVSIAFAGEIGYYITDAQFGYHIGRIDVMSEGKKFTGICTGKYYADTDKNGWEYKSCEEVADLFQLINADSLGTYDYHDGHSELHRCIIFLHDSMFSKPLNFDKYLRRIL